MSMRIRFLRDPGQKVVATVERLSDGQAFDGKGFSAVGSGTFPVPLRESLPPWGGRYETVLDTSSWTDGNYLVHFHLVLPGGSVGPVLGMAGASIYKQDDGPVPPAVIQIVTPAGTIVSQK